MPLATTCIYNGRQIGMDEAIRIYIAPRGRAGKPVLTCVECGDSVRPHRSRNGHTPHIEHVRRNSSCSLSHRRSRREPPRPHLDTFPLDDIRAIEGHAIDRLTLMYGRNRAIAEQRKTRDDYRCLACGFRLAIEGRFIIECHHLKPVAGAGLRQVRLDELVSLCPTCHRVAHTRADPYSLEEIRALRHGAE